MDDLERHTYPTDSVLDAAVQSSRTLTPAQLMERLQVSENTVYRELQNGFLKDIACRVGRQWRVSEAALERLLQGGA